MHRLLSRGLTLTLFVGLLAAPAAFAQQTLPAPQPEVTTDFEEADLDAFAEAYVDIEDLQLQYQAQHGDVEDPAQLQELQMQFQTDAAEIIEGRGLSLERYEQIIVATQADAEFAEGLLERVEAVRIERAG